MTVRQTREGHVHKISHSKIGQRKHVLCKQKLILADPRVKINMKAADERSFSVPQECN